MVQLYRQSVSRCYWRKTKQKKRKERKFCPLTKRETCIECLKDKTPRPVIKARGRNVDKHQQTKLSCIWRLPGDRDICAILTVMDMHFPLGVLHDVDWRIEQTKAQTRRKTEKYTRVWLLRSLFWPLCFVISALRCWRWVLAFSLVLRWVGFGRAFCKISLCKFDEWVNLALGGATRL